MSFGLISTWTFHDGGKCEQKTFTLSGAQVRLGSLCIFIQFPIKLRSILLDNLSIFQN